MEFLGIKQPLVKQQVLEYKDCQDPFLNFMLWKESLLGFMKMMIQ